MGVIPGHIKDEVVVLGNHRDGESKFCLWEVSNVLTYLVSLGMPASQCSIGMPADFL